MSPILGVRTDPPKCLRKRAAACVAWLLSMALAITIIGSDSTVQAQEDAVNLGRLLQGRPPASADELVRIQTRIQQLTEQILPATVAVQVGRANGSGVIIDAEGHVLTAAHVAGRPGRTATIHLPDGRDLRGITLGLNQELDSGLIQITDEGKWPFVPLGSSKDVHEGHWCLATGHPGGFVRDRPPVLRWGRVLRSESSAILTDCTLVGGDSGGPLFDMNGNVIGIHSRIGKNLSVNVHVPIDPFRQSWDRLTSGEVWGILAQEAPEPGPEFASAGEAWLGVVQDPKATQARVLRVVSESPAERYGIQSGDIIVTVENQQVTNFVILQRFIREFRPGQRIDLQLDRSGTLIDLRVRLSRRTE